MKMQLSGQAEDLVRKSELVIITERVDDVALLIGQMSNMGLPEIWDRHIPRHWKQRGRSWGWTAVIWLASILTEGDHRKVSVATYIAGMKHTLNQWTAQVIEPLDFRDDRLSHLLKHVRKPRYWHPIERDLHARSIAGYDLSQEAMRWDATTVSGDHEVTAGGLWQFGQSKDDPTRPQIKIMMGSLDPVGMPLSTDVWSGERADEGLSLPLMERIRTGVSTSGLLFVGDGKMSALESRTSLARHRDFSWSPWPLTGSTAEAMDAWIAEGVAQGGAGELERIVRTNDRGHEGLAAEGYEFERTCGASVGAEEWTERVLVVRSPMHANQQAAGLETRLGHAEQPRAALTPPRGRGKRQITNEATLVEAIDTVLKAHRVDGLLRVAWGKADRATNSILSIPHSLLWGYRLKGRV
jgi:transposase